MVEKRINSPCTVDNKNNSSHATTDDFSGGVILSIAIHSGFQKPKMCLDKTLFKTEYKNSVS